MNFWQRKLLAFLHDPPHKALDIPGHEDNRSTFVRQAGLTDPAAMQWFDRPSDWWAAAADRYPAFRSGLRSAFGGAEHPFKHPLGGSELVIPQFPTAEALGGLLQATQPGEDILPSGIAGEERDRINFFLHWRRWPVESSQADWRAAFQPADTRIPDHPIWLHNSITSALQGCDLEPAFLLFQIGPVQDYIAQARSTRDLWSGSYMLSWLMGHAMKAVTNRVGPDAVLFPFLRAQPLFDLLHRDLYSRISFRGQKGDDQHLWARLKVHEREMLVPNLPNKFLALVPAAEAASLARAAESALQGEIAKIAAASWDWLNARHPLDTSWKVRFDQQMESFVQVTWQVHAWPLRPEQLPDAPSYFGLPSSAFRYPPNPGQFWQRLYSELDQLHAARRNTRDFMAWTPGDIAKAGTPKDSFSGKEEVIGSEAWWADVRKVKGLGHLFRSSDKLGAINLVKKVWHLAYLRDQMGLDPKRAVQFDSVPDIAAAGWRMNLAGQLKQALSSSAAAFQHLSEACRAIHRHGPEWGMSTPEDPPSDQNLDHWISECPPECFSSSSWKQAGKECSEVISRLHRLYQIREVGAPPGYVAVIAFDGDEMGKWVSGDKLPMIADQLSIEARQALGDQIRGRRRPLSPSYHLQFSEALANFALYLARPVVEHYGGELIYAGGDDVLAMVPAVRALDCGQALRNAFRGQVGLAGVYEVLGRVGGFVRLLHPKAEQPSWPLIVPGPRAEASVGLAVGHVKAPLQSLVRAAQAAEKRAKSGPLHRASFAISLFKRSGEIMEWGGKWEGGAVDLYQEFIRHMSTGAVSGRFAYALEELVSPYRNSGTMSNDGAFPTKQIAAIELERVLERQVGEPSVRAALRDLCSRYLAGLPEDRVVDDLPGLFKSAAFILRGERE
jgi:CRISPR-associated protein Cmr2